MRWMERGQARGGARRGPVQSREEISKFGIFGKRPRTGDGGRGGGSGGGQGARPESRSRGHRDKFTAWRGTDTAPRSGDMGIYPTPTLTYKIHIQPGFNFITIARHILQKKPRRLAGNTPTV